MPTPRDFRHTALGFVLGALTCAGVATASAPRGDLLHLVGAARQELASVQRLARELRDPYQRHRLETHAWRLDGHLGAVEQAAYGVPQRPYDPPSRPARPGDWGRAPVVTSDAELRHLLAAVRAEPFSDGRRALLFEVTRDRWFTSAQVVSFLELFPFSGDKVEAAVQLYPRVVDPQSWYVVYGAFSFSSDKEAVRRRLGL